MNMNTQTVDERCDLWARMATKHCEGFGYRGGEEMEDSGYISYLADRIIALRTAEAAQEVTP